MKTIQDILDFVHSYGAKCVVVTKYGDKDKTQALYSLVKDHPAFLALGENRLDVMQEKGIPKADMHFIGHLQSRALKHVPHYASAVHSVCSLKHAKMCAEMGVPCYIQVNVSCEENKDGVLPGDFSGFWEELQQGCPELGVLGVSGMGSFEYTEKEKRAEFQVLKKIRDEYIPGGSISAGTSVDYQIALDEGVDVVRLGTVIWELL